VAAGGELEMAFKKGLGIFEYAEHCRSFHYCAGRSEKVVVVVEGIQL